MPDIEKFREILISSAKKYFDEVIPLLESILHRAGDYLPKETATCMSLLLKNGVVPIPVSIFFEAIAYNPNYQGDDKLVNVSNVLISLKDELETEKPGMETVRIILEDLTEHVKKL